MEPRDRPLTSLDKLLKLLLKTKISALSHNKNKTVTVTVTSLYWKLCHTEEVGNASYAALKTIPLITYFVWNFM